MIGIMCCSLCAVCASFISLETVLVSLWLCMFDDKNRNEDGDEDESFLIATVIWFIYSFNFNFFKCLQ